MVNYYEVLKVSPKASGAEIKSAYRRLARKLHPDKNNGSEETALKFAAIAEAYEVLGNAKERARYDRRLLDVQFTSTNGNGFFDSENRHVRRWRQMVYEKRYNDIIDRMIAEERREAIALQRFLFPVVALFVALVFVSIVRPNVVLTHFSDVWLIRALVRIVVVTLFAIGVVHMVGRLRESFDRFGYDERDIHDSILDETELPLRPWSRYSLLAVLIIGGIACLVVGFGISYGFQMVSTSGYLFAPKPTLDLLLFPPIFVLIVDIVHSVILYEERGGGG